MVLPSWNFLAYWLLYDNRGGQLQAFDAAYEEGAPYLVDQTDIAHWKLALRVDMIPHMPFVYTGTEPFKGYKLVARHFVDTTRMDGPYTPVLPLPALVERLKPGRRRITSSWASTNRWADRDDARTAENAASTPRTASPKPRRHVEGHYIEGLRLAPMAWLCSSMRPQGI